MTDTLTSLLDGLRPYPEDGSRADGPVAVDATDRLVLEEAGAAIESAGPGEVVTIGDRFGALTLGAIALGARDVRVHQDPVDAEAALRANALVARRGAFGHHPLGPELLRGALVVLLQLPKSLAELTEIAEQVARHAADDVVLYAGGRVKHMTHAMNDVLGALFSEVTPSLARRKSRLLVARGPVPGARERRLTYPVREVLPDVPGFDGPVTVVAHGGVFGGGTLDGGTRLLLARSSGWPPSSARQLAVDLGCGSGILATALALRGAEVVATDRSAAAVASAAATAAANGVGHLVRTVRDDAGSSLPDGSADLVLLNPPFHDRAAVSTDAAHRMFAAAGRVLRPGGELWTVFNSALRYRPALDRAVGPTEQVARDRRFTVTRSIRRDQG
ncbi:class I SAM-dependent methyltransferase [Myceligenerans xiligouense]|uniref:16S rRNA m(2)G 1207 methyltransferase /23S rRNA m(2)G-1835 methyltransferase n=1 Tax=Myceligenerans xiligouense TaxID=253184 RepID=A0A3N4YFW9_9MICO|nr:methyltransferase [Myceligenerans xiligouense]RPF20039.1 16S rRNA m(2)G 1207 methyltransferase /23S rRNA m(2)G-1835 methyltransferase [Myceligenerans xiligouense]